MEETLVRCGDFDQIATNNALIDVWTIHNLIEDIGVIDADNTPLIVSPRQTLAVATLLAIDLQLAQMLG
jgi:hypothetical protein